MEYTVRHDMELDGGWFHASLDEKSVFNVLAGTLYVLVGSHGS